MAITNLESYRRFRGTLRQHPLRFWPITTAGIRVASKKKLPLVLLYAIPVIGTVVFAFFVYGKYAAELQMVPDESGEGGGLVGLLAQRAMKQLQVRNNIVTFNTWSQLFALLPAAWFGTPMFAKDLKAGAHQLYFCRPMTRLDYFFGKFLTAAFFTACAVLVPGLVICLVASFSSPEWSFLIEEGDVIWRSILYSVVWIVVTSSVALCVSSLAPRFSYALIAFFGVFMMPAAMGKFIGDLEGDVYQAISPIDDLRRVAGQIFQLERGWPDIPLALAWLVLVGLVAVSLLIVAVRLRRLEVVG